MFTATFVMLRAGLQLNTTTLRDHPRFIMLLALVPCTMEMCAVAVCAKSLLDLPWGWAFLLGSITACLSPVIPINTMLALAEEGYGEDKHMASLLLTAASIDDVHIVSVYAICFSFVFNHDEGQGGSYWWSIFPNEIKDLLLGITFGTVLGIFFVFFPHRKHKYVVWYRICGLVLGSLVCVASTYKVTITGSGYLATIIMSLIATSGWRVLTAAAAPGRAHNVAPDAAGAVRRDGCRGRPERLEPRPIGPLRHLPRLRARGSPGPDGPGGGAEHRHGRRRRAAAAHGLRAGRGAHGRGHGAADVAHTRRGDHDRRPPTAAPPRRGGAQQAARAQPDQAAELAARAQAKTLTPTAIRLRWN
ncbi:unnamed protein product [Trichogramma brassicae]|uniref:Cation/H+ exchanger transmembrane domain-containing protein n=1 Tax=Trichogramma brassicae TaxID=86971 RepID=A0A6H5IAK2_9HYME|nr:unnamed protein product [Trichogramma brassicae]